MSARRFVIAAFDQKRYSAFGSSHELRKVAILHAAEDDIQRPSQRLAAEFQRPSRTMHRSSASAQRGTLRLLLFEPRQNGARETPRHPEQLRGCGRIFGRGREAEGPVGGPVV